jgi:heme-degrading monooxygenase HmoA
VIRVIYRWQIEPENFDEFRRAWSATTNQIHEPVPGALGSFMLRACEDGSEVLTVAKWDSIASWKKFLGRYKPDRNAGNAGIR